MNQHRTQDHSLRAHHIAIREAEKVWQQTRDFRKYHAVYESTYYSVIAEMQHK